MNAQSALRELSSGAQLANRYTLTRKLGQGGLAETWLASDRMTGSDVALKIQNSKDANRALLHDEWQTSIRLMHPHIVRVFEFHDDAAGAFYSLQPVEGPDASVLAGQGPGAILPVIAALADALRYAHGKGIVHRDVKASNVLLDRNGAPYLIDFGSAAAAGAPATGGSLVAATPASLRGEPADAADDVFALGGLTWELIAGRSPYSQDALADDIEHRVPDPLVPASGEPLDAHVAALVARMLDKDPTARPGAEAVVEALAEAGYRPGVAPKSLVAGHATNREEIIEARAAAPRKRERSVAPPPDVSDKGGFSPRNVGIALLVLVVLLLGVVFYLPSTVDDGPAVTDTGVEGDPAAVDESPVAEDPQPAEADRAPPQRDERVEARQSTEAVLGRLLANMETLEGRAVQRWAGPRYAQAEAVYQLGDQAYLERDYTEATVQYEKAIEMLEPLLSEVDGVFSTTLAEAEDALANADAALALERFDLAVAISSGSRRAQEGYERARNLDEVLSLVEAGIEFEDNLELNAARESFQRAMELDAKWQPARDGHARVLATMEQMDFDARMSEGLQALATEDFEVARAAFRMAKSLRPNSTEPADGLMQVDQGLRLAEIRQFEARVANYEQEERWEDAVETYESILELDPDLEFAKAGLANATGRVNLHKQLDDIIAEPDSLSAPSNMQRATSLVVSITRMDAVGPRLEAQRDELSRLLKRAATPLTVELVSDNLTEVSVYKVGRLGTFASQRLELRPGTYVAVGSRAGYRDERVEFQVGPEIDMQPIVVRCEDPI